MMMDQTKEHALTDIVKKFESSFPNRKDEDWVNYDLGAVFHGTYQLPQYVEDEPSKRDGFYLHFKHNQLVSYHLPDGASLSKKDKHVAASSNGLIQMIQQSAETIQLDISNCESTIHIIQEATENTFACHCFNIVAHESTVTFNRTFIAPKNALLFSYCTVSVNNQSNVIIHDQNKKNDGKILEFSKAWVQADCHFYGLNQSFFSTHSRFDTEVFIEGESATARLHGIGLNHPKQELFYNTHVHHNVANTESHQLFKSVNQDDALFEYNGKVSVKKHAQNIESYQLNQNIVLDEVATVYSRPQLFIDADDVSCTHGSTTGDLNQEALFYLMSRGLGEEESKRMILHAFILEAFNHPQFEPFKPTSVLFDFDEQKV